MAFDLDIAKRLGDADIALRLEAGEGVTILFGPSGAGKTSVLNMIAGLLRPDRGHIRVGDTTLFGNGVDLPPDRRKKLRTAIRDLSAMPPDQRQQVIDSDRFKNEFSPEERGLLSSASQLPLAPAENAPNEPAPED